VFRIVGELCLSTRSSDICTPRSCAAWTCDMPRSLIRRAASSLKPSVYFRLSMTHQPGAGHVGGFLRGI